jgi:hypothetical protein
MEEKEKSDAEIIEEVSDKVLETMIEIAEDELNESESERS